MLLMKANNHGRFCLPKNCSFIGIQDKFNFFKFHKFKKTCKKTVT